MTGISPGDSLAVQTGIKHKTVNTIHLQGDWGAKQDETWEILLHAKESPIIIDAMPGDFIVGNHAHAVLNATEEGGKRRSVGLFALPGRVHVGRRSLMMQCWPLQSMGR